MLKNSYPDTSHNNENSFAVCGSRKILTHMLEHCCKVYRKCKVKGH